MSNYLTTTSLQTLMIGTSFDSITTALAVKANTWAENEINKYLSKRYDLGAFDSVSSAPPILISIGEDLSVGYMYAHMARGGKDAFSRADFFIKSAIENLKEIRDYKCDLINSSGDVIADSSNTAYRVLCNTTGYSQTFNEDDPLHWEVDQDKLNDIEDDRT